MLKELCRTATLGAALLGTAALAAPPETPVPFSADYAVYRGSLHLATSHFTLSQDGPHTYVYQSHTEAVGLLAMLRDDVITETSRFNVTDGQFRPISYHYEQTGGSTDKRASLLFNWADDTVESKYKGNEKTLKLKTGMLDRFMAQLVLAHDAGAGELKDQYVVVDKGKIKIYELHRGGEKTFDTPAGSFKAILVERIDGKDKTQFWCAPELNYVPVVMEQVRDGKPNIRMELTQIKVDSDKPGQSTPENNKKPS